MLRREKAAINPARKAALYSSLTSQLFEEFRARHGYAGKILHEPCSPAIRQRLTHAIAQFHILDQLGTPMIPYVAAWRDDGLDIWYEFAGSTLRTLLGSGSNDLAAAFRESLISRCMYRKFGSPPAIIKVVRDREQLRQLRSALRAMAQQGQGVEAVYRLEVHGEPLWFKDFARVELFEEDGLFLSFGTLADITKEVTLEEELKQAKHELARHRDQLAAKVERKTRKLRQAQLEVVTRLAQAAACRDHRTGGHISRMSHYSKLLARSAGIRDHAATVLFHATPLHDVGKLGITDLILHKPGRLTVEEFEVMKGHCRLGAGLLDGQGSDLLRVAQTVALTHHERWDGSGYPAGLAGPDIPLAGRIAAICDVFDALTEERPYKPAWTFAQAAEEIRRQRGRHFDPDLVDLFLGNLPALFRIYRGQTN
ncbi:MAG: HD domain-containing phosphohydrolase [Thermodesulfobacteriota bacterium]